jgi:hypothetical protein
MNNDSRSKEDGTDGMFRNVGVYNSGTGHRAPGTGHRGNTQTKEHNVQNKAKALNKYNHDLLKI